MLYRQKGETKINPEWLIIVLTEYFGVRIYKIRTSVWTRRKHNEKRCKERIWNK